MDTAYILQGGCLGWGELFGGLRQQKFTTINYKHQPCNITLQPRRSNNDFAEIKYFFFIQIFFLRYLNNLFFPIGKKPAPSNLKLYDENSFLLLTNLIQKPTIIKISNLLMNTMICFKICAVLNTSDGTRKQKTVTTPLQVYINRDYYIYV